MQIYTYGFNFLDNNSVSSSQRKTTSIQEEECLTMLGGMTIYRNEKSGEKGGIEPMNKGLENLKLVEDKIKSTIQASRRKEKEESKSTRGQDDY